MKHHTILSIILLFAAIPIRAMSGDDEPAAKRFRQDHMERMVLLSTGIRCNLEQEDHAAYTTLLEAIEEQMLLLSKGVRYDLEMEECKAYTTLLEKIEDEMSTSGLFNCPICSERFSYEHRIVALTCGKHRVCEPCAIKLLCPRKKKTAPPNPCPVCRQEPSKPVAASALLRIAYNQATRDGRIFSLFQTQNLFMDQPDEEEEDNLTADAIREEIMEYMRQNAEESSEESEEETSA